MTLAYLRIEISINGGICSYLEKSRIDRKAVLLMGRVVAPNLSSDKRTLT